MNNVTKTLNKMIFYHTKDFLKFKVKQADIIKGIFS